MSLYAKYHGGAYYPTGASYTISPYLEQSSDAGFTPQTDSKQLICRQNSTAVHTLGTTLAPQ